MTDKPPRHRRWIPVSVRIFATMLVLVSVGSALWIGVPAYRQATLIREIERSGGIVLTQPRSPYCLQRWTRDDRVRRWIENVEVVGLGQDATDETLGRLRILRELARLDLRGTKVTDAGLVQLKCFTGLTEVALANTSVADAGLAHLTTNTGLERLSLGTEVTDAGLARLPGLNGLHYLRLSGTRVTDEGLRHLYGLNLRCVWLNNNPQITEAGVAGLKGAIPGLAVGE